MGILPKEIKGSIGVLQIRQQDIFNIPDLFSLNDLGDGISPAINLIFGKN